MRFLQKYGDEILHYNMAFMGGFMGLYAICAHGSYASAQTGNLMNLVIDLLSGDPFSAAARVGALLLFSGGIAASWLMHEFCALPMKELCLAVDAGALLLAALLPDGLFPFFRLYPLFFASSFQWGSFGGVGKYASATLFLTGNLKNCIVYWLRFLCYRKPEALDGARIYTLTISCYLLGGCLGCMSVRLWGDLGAFYGFVPLGCAALLLAAQKAAKEPPAKKAGRKKEGALK